MKRANFHLPEDGIPWYYYKAVFYQMCIIYQYFQPFGLIFCMILYSRLASYINKKIEASFALKLNINLTPPHL